MFDLIAKDNFMLGVYILFTLFLFCLEFLVVLIKIGSKNSIDEDLEKAREKLLRTKTQKTLDRSSIFFNPEEFVSSVQSANSAIQKRLKSNNKTNTKSDVAIVRELCANLKQMRLNRNISQTKLAELSGLDQAAGIDQE